MRNAEFGIFSKSLVKAAPRGAALPAPLPPPIQNLIA